MRPARRVKQYHQRSAQYDQILKKNEQMHALVAITLALCPAAQRQLDENVFNTLRDKCATSCGRHLRITWALRSLHAGLLCIGRHA